MVRDHLSVVLGTAERFDPLRRVQVLQCPLGTWNLPVGHVADKDVLERELRFPFHRAPPRALHEVLLSKRLQLLLLCPERAEPEDLADHGRVLQQCFLVRRKRVETRTDDALDRLRERQVAGAVAFGEHPHELLRVERIPTRAVQQRGLRLRLEQRPFAQGGDQPCRFLLRERRDRDRSRVHLPTAPGGPALEQLQPRRAEIRIGTSSTQSTRCSM